MYIYRDLFMKKMYPLKEPLQFYFKTGPFTELFVMKIKLLQNFNVSKLEIFTSLII